MAMVAESLLANIWLHLHDHKIAIWPAALGEESPIRSEYIEAIKAADRGEYDNLAKLHERFTQPE